MIIHNGFNEREWDCVTSNKIQDFNFFYGGSIHCLPSTYYEDNQRLENITDWALDEFQKYYKNKSITKQNIFHYIYGVLHDPSYREKYKINLQRDYPRIPLYSNKNKDKDFQKWAQLGSELMSLHLHFETAPFYDVKVVNADAKPKILIPKGKAHKEQGIVEIDNYTKITGIPQKAWEYKLGLRSPIEWALDQHKPIRASKSQLENYGVIFKKFNTPEFENARFFKQKDHLIDLIKRLCTVSVKTVELVEGIK